MIRYIVFMRSVADHLRKEHIKRVQAMSPEERVELAFRLGDDDVASLAHARGISLLEAKRLIRKSRQVGRRYSACMEAINNRSSR